MIVLCRAVQPYRRLMRLTMVKHTHQKKQKKKDLLFMIIIDHQWRWYTKYIDTSIPQTVLVYYFNYFSTFIYVDKKQKV